MNNDSNMKEDANESKRTGKNAHAFGIQDKPQEARTKVHKRNKKLLRKQNVEGMFIQIKSCIKSCF